MLTRLGLSTARLTAPRVPVSIGVDQVRHATKRGGGTTSNNRSSPGQRLGLKLFSDQWAEPGNIILRQRGTQFHPGQNVYMGKDHTLHAEIPGFVRFYRIQKGRKERRYIGIARERGEKLPRDEAARGRSRYFGFVESLRTQNLEPQMVSEIPDTQASPS